ncbi:MAG: hypothetical protein JNK87_30985 [Bryobacterales bacterium]|nr:hypothetical protein [Bryobacterales bacterium]
MSLQQPAPAITREPLSDLQLRTLKAIAAPPAVWQRETNIWQAWGLPDSSHGLRSWLSQPQ